MTISIAVLASGRGSDFQSIIDGIKAGQVDARIKLFITDNPEAKAIERAKENKIPVAIIPRADYPDRLAHDLAIKAALDKAKPDLVVLAGYMRIIKSPALLSAYSSRIVNIHPSLLPEYPGAHAQRDAFEAGEKISGLTIHFVDEHLDGGPIIYQEKVDISACKSADEASAKILAREHLALPRIVDTFAKGKYVLEGGKVKYLPGPRVRPQGKMR